MHIYMGEYLIEAGSVALVYALTKWIEAKYIRKSGNETRRIIKDSVVVCVSAVIALWGASQLGVSQASTAPTQAFVGKPEF
jgi:hypothetical protein